MQFLGLFKRLFAILLCLTVALSFSNLSSVTKVSAKTTTYNLTTKNKGTKKVTKNPYGSDYICDIYENTSLPSDITNNLGKFKSLKFQISVKVRGISKGGMILIPYAMDSSFSNWKEVESSVIKKGKTYKLTLNLKSYKSIGKIGIRIASNSSSCNGATFKYTINYAKIKAVRKGSSSSSSSSSSASGLKYKVKGKTKSVKFAKTPVGKHGALHLAKLSGYTAPVIVGEDGKKVNLRGVSTHGMHWGEMTPYVNKKAFQNLRDEWGVNTVRLVSYVTQGGYTQGSKDLLDQSIVNGVKYAKELGMYVIIDWHIHAENPWTTVSDAKKFFKKYAKKYKDYDNVIFEICNEPTNVSWYTGGNDLHKYAKTITKIIRNQGSNAIVVCGTNTWSQDVDDVIGHDLNNEGFKNVMYTFHFYSATHYSNLMDKVTKAYKAGVPIFVTEFGTCDASGGGGYDFSNATKWIKLLDKYGIPYCNWSLCNKNEAASLLKTSCSVTSGFKGGDLSKSGVWLVNTYRARQAKE
ncbi:MAG: glycoside hydrolase family 5 protein [Lachnospiraceae bacterium]|nr:glycoside hydrolase family 5 protein [Lachnospiraceae bacterium]